MSTAWVVLWRSAVGLPWCAISMLYTTEDAAAKHERYLRNTYGYLTDRKLLTLQT